MPNPLSRKAFLQVATASAAAPRRLLLIEQPAGRQFIHRHKFLYRYGNHPDATGRGRPAIRGEDVTDAGPQVQRW